MQAEGRARQPGQGDRRPQHGQAVVPPARLRMSGGHPHLTISPTDREAAGSLLPPGRRRFAGHDGSPIAPASLLAGQQNRTRHDRLLAEFGPLYSALLQDRMHSALLQNGCATSLFVPGGDSGVKGVIGTERRPDPTETVMKKMITLAALAAAFLVAPAQAQSGSAQPASLAVNYSDLDLSNPADVRKLDRRIEIAARTACGPTSSADPEGHAGSTSLPRPGQRSGLAAAQPRDRRSPAGFVHGACLGPVKWSGLPRGRRRPVRRRPIPGLIGWIRLPALKAPTGFADF